MQSFIDRANHLLSYGGPRELFPLLLECVVDGGDEAMQAIKILARDMYGGFTMNYEMKAPAAFALLAWKGDGIREIVKNFSEEYSLKNSAIVISTLSPVAAGLYPSKLFVGDGDLSNAVLARIGDINALKDIAQAELTSFIMGMSDPDDVALYIAMGLQHLAMGDAKAVVPLFQSLAARYTTVGLPRLHEYEELIVSASKDEPKIHQFFDRNPLFLDPQAHRVWSKPDFHGKLEPDFVIQRSDNSYLVIEIETPGKPIVTGRNQLSAETTHAITQVLEYRSFLVERYRDSQVTFPNFSIPDCMVVIGRRDKLTDEQLRVLKLENEHRANIKIVGFDELATRMRSIINNVISSGLTVETVRLN